MNLKIKKLNPNAIIPKRATEGSAGMDIFACIEKPITLLPMQTELIPTGIAISLPSKDYAAFIYARSGLAVKFGIAPANCVGVIDSDYRGEILVGLRNHSSKEYTINPNDRIAQMLISPVCTFDTEEVFSLDETQRSDGGFGSTGKN